LTATVGGNAPGIGFGLEVAGFVIGRRQKARLDPV